MQVCQFCMALTNDFESVQSSLLHRESPPSLEIVISEVLAEETILATMKSQHNHSFDHLVAAMSSSSTVGAVTSSSSDSKKKSVTVAATKGSAADSASPSITNSMSDSETIFKQLVNKTVNETVANSDEVKTLDVLKQVIKNSKDDIKAADYAITPFFTALPPAKFDQHYPLHAGLPFQDKAYSLRRWVEKSLSWPSYLTEWCHWVDRVVKYHEDVLRKQDLLAFVLLIKREFSYDGATLGALSTFCNRCWNYFHLPCGPMSASLLDIAAITGLPVDGEGISCVSSLSAEDDPLYHIIFIVGTPSHACTSEYIHLAKLMASGKRLALGQYVLGVLYRGLYNFTPDVAGVPHGPFWILQLWAWKYFPALSPPCHAPSSNMLCYGELYHDQIHSNNNIHVVFQESYRLRNDHVPMRMAQKRATFVDGAKHIGSTSKKKQKPQDLNELSLRPIEPDARAYLAGANSLSYSPNCPPERVANYETIQDLAPVTISPGYSPSIFLNDEEMIEIDELLASNQPYGVVANIWKDVDGVYSSNDSRELGSELISNPSLNPTAYKANNSSWGAIITYPAPNCHALMMPILKNLISINQPRPPGIFAKANQSRSKTSRGRALAFFDALRAYHGLEEHNGAIGDHCSDKLGDSSEVQEVVKVDSGLKASLEEHGVEDRPLLREVAPSHGTMTGHDRPLHGSIAQDHTPTGHNRPMDPLTISQGPMTRARAKRFKEALLGFVRSHLGGLESIEDQLESIEVDITKNIPIDSKVFTLLEINEH
ncbi:hypothetical protein CCACVL1_03563 [Corchorus capsularis]|uniref:Aminotransferase-like plant mobile domain-containing protein n=1 Tax=Corchorus capsularis TaxID=210143 RepID=A0A1R3JYJ1_COCAP|nr:hypothetical protein CCACVL1_03563 [Corchorus capsularis]